MGFRGVLRDEHYERGGILPIRFIADNLFVRLSAISRYTGYPITLSASFDPVSMYIVVPTQWIPAFAGMTVMTETTLVPDRLYRVSSAAFYQFPQTSRSRHSALWRETYRGRARSWLPLRRMSW